MSLYHSIKLEEETHYNISLSEARKSFEKDILYRKWVALEGGVYVPISDHTPPNPYLNVPNKIVETKEGIKLTLINPAYMTRMVHGLEKTFDQTKSRIVSLQPLNPINTPDKWEAEALKQLGKGLKEKHEIQIINDKKYLRYLAPFIVEKNCLKCHEQQGYKVGDIRGGISVMIPYEQEYELYAEDVNNVIFFHLSSAIVVFVILFFNARSYYKQKINLQESNQRILDVSNSAGIGYWEFDISSNKIRVTEGWLEFLGYNSNELGDDYTSYLQLLPSEDVEKFTKILDDLKSGKIPEFSIEHKIRLKDQSYRWVLSKGKVVKKSRNIPTLISGVQIDIDRDKRIIENIFKYHNEFKVIFNHSPIPSSITYLKDGKFLAVNLAWEKVSGYKSEEAIGKTSIELNLWHNPKDREKFAKEIYEKGYVSDIEFLFRNRKGKLLTAKVSASIVEIDNEKFIVANIEDITEKKKQEKKLKKEKELYSFFNYLYSSTDDMSDKDFYDLSIEYLVKLTDSKVGFFHQISEDQKEIILTTWNKEAKEFCNAEFETHYPIDKAGNWTDCLKTNKPIVYNDYKNSPNQKGLPLGHVSIERFMSVATYLNEKPFLIFVVGNKELEYDEVDAELTQLFANQIARLIERRQFICKIKENERFVSTLINNLPGFVYRCANDRNWTMFYLSENTENFTGYKANELLNNHLLCYNDIIHPEFREEGWNKVQFAIQNNLPYELEYQIIRRDGKIIWVWERGQAVRDKDGNVLFLEGFITDIDDKKRLELELVKSEEKYRLIAENTADVISVFDLNLNYVYLSPSVKNVMGYTPEENMKLGLQNILLPGYYEQVKSILLEELENEKNPNADPYRYRVLHLQEYNAKGEIVWIENTSTFLRDENKKPIGILATSRDITLRKNLEEALKESEEKFRHIFYGISIPELIIEPISGQIIEFNPAAVEFYGYSGGEIITKSIFDLDISSKEDCRYFIDEALHRNQLRFEKRHKLFNGEIADVEIFTSPLKLNRKDFLHLIIHDITTQKKLQHQIEESERRFRRLASNAKDVVFKFNIFPQPGFEFFNDVMIELTGYSREELTKDPKILRNLIHPDDFYLVEYLTIKTEEEIKKPFISRWITKQGDIKWIEHRLIPLYDDDDNLIALEGILRDITERVEYETMLIESENKYRALFENMTSGFVLFELIRDENGNPDDLMVVAANNYFAETIGLELEKCVGHRLKQILPGIENDPADWIGEYIKVALTGKPITFENYSELLRKYFTVSAFQSEPNRCAVTFVDISEKKIKELELKKLSSAVEQSPLSIIITDVEGNIEYVNNYFTEKTGYTLNEVKGKNPRFLSTGKHSKEFYKRMWDTIKSGLVWEGLFYNVKKNGQKFWERAVISPVKDDKNRIVNFVAVKQDITEDILKEEQLDQYRKNLEKLVDQRTEEIKRANLELVEQIKIEKLLEKQLQEALIKEKELNELKTKFFASVSHEFRTPLAGVLSSTQMIRRYGKSWTQEKLDSHYQNIELLVSKLTELLDDILLISRADREILKNEPKPEDVEALFRGIIQQVSSSLPENRKIVFENLCLSQVMNLDSKLINHIVINLLTNAIKFGFDNTDIFLTLLQEENDLIVKVKNRGIGIPEDDLENIFEPFYRSSNSISIKGTGLGLNIVKRCVDIVNGKISVESKLNEETIFTVRIPVNV
jgi:PAS domain S-box-containing protein